MEIIFESDCNKIKYWDIRNLFEATFSQDSKIIDEPMNYSQTNAQLGQSHVKTRDVSYDKSKNPFPMFQSDYPALRKSLHRVVRLLEQAYEEGVVETLGDSPPAEDVLNLSRKEIMDLRVDLVRKFFPFPQEETQIYLLHN